MEEFSVLFGVDLGEWFSFESCFYCRPVTFLALWYGDIEITALDPGYMKLTGKLVYCWELHDDTTM